MSFVQVSFFCLAAATVYFYYAVPPRFQWLAALAASLAFYVSYGVERLPFILASSLIAYLAARKMDKIQRKTEKAADAKKKCRPVLFLALAGLIGLLLYAKIGTWVMRSVGRALRVGGAETARAIVALGVSYYTFSLISYVVDVYWRRDTAETSYWRLLAFAIYFPKILQGPISRHKELAPQMFTAHDFSYTRFCFGAQRILWGCFKKLVIADRLALPVDLFFTRSGDIYTGPAVLFGLLLYGIQIYSDFSGAMDIAAGISQMLGLRLEQNFRQPYFSRSVEEFWRRWHITLGAFMRDYVFYPLSLSKAFARLGSKARNRFGASIGKKLPSFLAMLIVYLLVGLWHGISGNYVVYGLWNSVIISSGILLSETYAKARARCGIDESSPGWRLFQILRTVLICSVGRVFSRSADLKSAVKMLGAMLKNPFNYIFLTDKTLLDVGLTTSDWILLMFSAAILLAVDVLHEKGVHISAVLGEQFIVFRWIVYFAAFFAVIVFGHYGPGYNAASFIYMRF